MNNCSNTADMIKNRRKLTAIKLVHTVIWGIMAAAIFYILYAGIFNRVRMLVWLCIGLIIVEGVVLAFFRWRCPLTLQAYKYTDNRDIGFDIFLPAWLAKYNKIIFLIIFIIGVILVFWRVLYNT